MTVPTFTTQPTIALSGASIVATPGTTTNTLSTTYTWLRDQVPLDLETGTSIVANSYPGVIQVVQTATSADGETASALSSPLANGSNDDIVFQDDFNGAGNNQPLSAWGHGWIVDGATATQQNHILTLVKSGQTGLGSFFNDGGVDTGGGHLSYAVAHVDTGGVNHAVEADFIGSSNANYIVFAYKDDKNFCEVRFGGSGSVINLQIFSVIDGVRTSRMTGINYFLIPTPTSSGTIRVELTGGLVSLFYKHDGDTLFTQYGVTAGSTPKPGNDVIDLNAATGIQFGTGVGYRGAVAFVNAIRAIALAAPVLVKSVSVSSVHNSPTISAALIYEGAPSGFDMEVMSATSGRLILPRSAAVIDTMGDGNANVHVTSPILRGAEGDTVMVQVWPVEAGDAKTLVVPHYPTIEATILGINEGLCTRSHSALPGRNLFETGGISTKTSTSTNASAVTPDAPVRASDCAASELGMGFDGVIEHQATTNPDATKKMTFTMANFIAPSQAGDYLVTGLPLSATVSFSGVTVTSGPSGGSCVISVDANPPETRVPRTMTIQGTFNEPVYPVATKVGDTSTERYADVAAANMTALGRIGRFMSARHVVGDKVATTTDLSFGARSDAERWTGYTGIGPMAVETCLSCCNVGGLHYWHNISHLADDSLVEAEAQLVADGLDPSLKCYVELSNEVWNTSGGYQEEACYFRLKGSRQGLGNAGTDGPMAIRDFRANCDQATGIISVAVVDGENVFCSIYGIGFLVYRAIGDQPIGASVKDPGKFSVIYDNTYTDTAGRRAFSDRSVEVWAIFDSVFADADRERPIHVLGSRISSSNYDQIALDWNDNYLHVDRVAVAPYWGQNTVDYSNYGIDDAAFLSTYFNDLDAAVDSLINTSLVPRKAALMNYCLAKDIAVDAIQLCAYEGGWYGNFPGAPAGFEAAMFKTVVRDSRMGDAWARFMAGWADRVGGELVHYDRIMDIPSGDDTSYFSLMEGEDDNVTDGTSGTNWRFKAVAEFNAAH